MIVWTHGVGTKEDRKSEKVSACCYPHPRAAKRVTCSLSSSFLACFLVFSSTTPLPSLSLCNTAAAHCSHRSICAALHSTAPRPQLNTAAVSVSRPSAVDRSVDAAAAVETPVPPKDGPGRVEADDEENANACAKEYKRGGSEVKFTLASFSHTRRECIYICTPNHTYLSARFEAHSDRFSDTGRGLLGRECPGDFHQTRHGI